jgi:hypothetical protein
VFLSCPPNLFSFHPTIYDICVHIIFDCDTYVPNTTIIHWNNVTTMHNTTFEFNCSICKDIFIFQHFLLFLDGICKLCVPACLICLPCFAFRKVSFPMSIGIGYNKVKQKIRMVIWGLSREIKKRIAKVSVDQKAPFLPRVAIAIKCQLGNGFLTAQPNF